LDNVRALDLSGERKFVVVIRTKNPKKVRMLKRELQRATVAISFMPSCRDVINVQPVRVYCPAREAFAAQDFKNASSFLSPFVTPQRGILFDACCPICGLSLRV